MRKTQVAIVGAGPIGLSLACALAMRGISFLVLEKRPQISGHSRAIGIHSPALKVLGKIGVAHSLIAQGFPVTTASAYWCDRPIARMHLGRVLSEPYPIVLSLPQVITERILEERLGELAPGSLRRGASVEGMSQTGDGVTLRVCEQGHEYEIRATYVVGCDGKNSFVREQAGIAFRGNDFPDKYAMGDFADDSPFGADAIIFLTPQGVVESFPLPHQQRRWVLHRGMVEDGAVLASDLTEAIAKRTGCRVNASTCTMTSVFGIQNYLADDLVSGRVILAGDAGHICSPLGGQGMNLGFMDIASLSNALAAAFATKAGDRVLQQYSQERRRMAKIVGKRAAFNTIISRGGWDARIRAMGMALMLRFSPTHDYYARQFTMHGLG